MFVFSSLRLLVPSDAQSSASLCTGAESNLGDIVLGEVEKDSFIALPGKGGHSGLLPSKTMCPNQEDVMRCFIAIVQGWGC